MTEDFTFGISGLDNLLSGVLRRGSLVVIVGCPGSGKTTLASTICYSNALKGLKCLYISFFEDSKKFFNQASNLGLDLYSLESEGLLKYVKLPIMYSVEELYNILPKLINSYKPDVLVIDSVNALLTSVSGRERAVLQNMIYEIPEAINGLVVLTAEMCEGVEDIMYIADTVLMLGYRSEGGLISRMLEIKKARGVSVTVGELPFTISRDNGFKVFVPPLFEELSGEGRELDLGCNVLRNALNHVHLGWSVYTSHTIYTIPALVIAAQVIIHVANNLRGLFISYKYPPEVLEGVFVRALTQYGLSKDESREVVRKHFTFKALNPYSYSISELLFRELELVDRYRGKVDSVTFQGVEITGTIYTRNEFYRHLYNQLNYLKRIGLLTIRIGRYVNKEFHNFNASLADVVMDYKIAKKDSKLELEAYLWRRGSRAPHILTQDDLDTCCREVLPSLQIRK